MRIDTDIEQIYVEIDGERYEVAEKTVAVVDALREAVEKCEGKPEYKLWLMELEILLGADAVRRLFADGKKENIDRLERIHEGVIMAFDHNAQEIREKRLQRQREALEPMQDYLRQLERSLRAGAKNKI